MSQAEPPLPHMLAELTFRASLVAFSKAFWDLEIVGAESLPPGPCFIYGNHSNNYDPFILNAFTAPGQGTAGVMTMEYLEKGPIAGLFASIGIVGTQKRVPEPHLIRRIMRLLDAGRRVVIFPEGGRRWDGRPAPWIESTAKLFARAGAPVYPVRIHGSYVGWPRWARYPRPAHIRVEPLPALDLDASRPLSETLRTLQAPIEMDENQVPESIRPEISFRPAVGVDRLLYRDPETGTFDGLSEEAGDTILGADRVPRWRMLPDSRLKNLSDGSIHLTGDMLNQIRSLPLDPDVDGVLIRNRVDVAFPDETRWQHAAELRLYTDRIDCQGHAIPLDSIIYSGLERSTKLWIVTRATRYGFRFSHGGSAFGWRDTIKRLAPHIDT